jgi:hypothetical protein
VLWTASTSIVTLSFKAKALVVSAVNGVGLAATVVAKVGLVVNIDVPHLFISIVVALVVPAVPVYKSAHNTLYGSLAYQALATSLQVAQIVQATAKFTIKASIAIYLKLQLSILAIVSPMKVIVVFVDTVLGIETIAILSVQLSFHLNTIPFLNIAVWSQTTVQDVLPTLVAVIAVQKAEPQAAGAADVQSVPLLVNTFPLVQGATLGTFLASLRALLVTYLASSVQVSTSLPAAFVIVFCLASSQDFNRFTVGYFVVLVSIVEFSLLAEFSAVYHNAACLPLNVLQSAALNTHLLAALAVGTLSVITGVVVQLATDEDKSVQVVPRVKAATLVTVQAHLAFICHCIQDVTHLT